MAIHDWTRVDAGVFHHLHTTWIPDIMRTLIPILPKGYYPMVEQNASGPIPDVLALQRSSGDNGVHRDIPPPVPGSGVIALAEAPPRTPIRSRIERDLYAARARIIAVRHSSDDRLVAVIEIVSPGNKHSKSAFGDFLEKSLDFLQSGVHLLIIDLFPPTPRDPRGIHGAIMSDLGDDEFIQPADAPLTFASYTGGLFVESFVQPAAVGDELPTMPLFLESDAYVNLPLAASYESAYSTVPPHWREVLEK